MAGSPQHATLVAATVTTLTFDSTSAGNVEVTNVDGTAPVYFTTDESTPVVAATGTHVVTAGAGAFLQVPLASGDGTTQLVKLISSGTPAVSVRAW